MQGDSRFTGVAEGVASGGAVCPTLKQTAGDVYTFSTPDHRSPRMRLATLTVLSLMLSACASHPPAERLDFTESLAQAWRLQPDQREHLQYYLSNSIRLVRSASGAEQGIVRGRLQSSGSRRVEELIVDRGAPGIVLASGSNWMAVSFYPGSYFYFVRDQPRQAQWIGNTWSKDRYYLYLPDWNGRMGSVMLGEGQWTATDQSVMAHLLVERESRFTAESRVYRQPGRWLTSR